MHIAQINFTAEQFKVALIVGQYVLVPLALWGCRHIFRDVVRTTVREEMAEKFGSLGRKIDNHIRDDEREFREVRHQLTKLAGAK